MADLTQGSDEDGEFEDPQQYKWAITVDTKTQAILAQRVGVGTDVGEYEADLGENVRVAVLFDDNVNRLLDAFMEIGGHSLECHEKISDLLNGIARSFGEAEYKLSLWGSLELGEDQDIS